MPDSQQTRILIADDDLQVGSLVGSALEREGYRVEQLLDGRDVVDRVLEGDYGLVVLDWMLPERSGIDCGRAIRARSAVPILMLTARSEEADVIRAIELCADDYVTKPFSVPELVVRVRALLRRRELDRIELAGTAGAPGIRLDLRRHEVSVDGQVVELTRTEFDLLALLASRPGELFSRGEMTRHLWRTDSSIDTRAADFHVRNIRRKIERDPSRPAHLVTVRGQGYRLVAPVGVLAAS